jgi:aminoglycoside phosphotransferase family enzyme/predicted kinase
MTRSTLPAAPEPQADIMAALGSGLLLGEAMPVRRIDTHCASIFLAGDRAWKVKRAVRFPYLDFSTPDLRRQALEAELRLNRRTAPGLYHRVHAMTRQADGELALDGAGETVDWVLEMTRFPDGALLSERAAKGPLDQAMLATLVDGMVAFHRGADVVDTPSGSARFRRAIEGNIDSLDAVAAGLEADKVARLVAALRVAMSAQSALLDRRAAAGRVRHLHGDLHLGNIALVDGVPLPFDCLEFDEELATIDTLYDLAFLLMDLWHRGLRAEAKLVFNRYLDLMPEDADGVALLPMLIALRATIRAHVLAAQAARHPDQPALAEAARALLDLALHCLLPRAALMVGIGGLSGTGKTTLARQLAPRLGPVPGARVLRSDVLRKHLAGVGPEIPLPLAAYGPGTGAAVYGMLAEMAAATLYQGHAVIGDAVFARLAERRALADIARMSGVRFVGLWLEAEEAERVRRVSGRRGDASDADAAVASAQSAYDVGALEDWQCVNAAGSAIEMGARAWRCLGVLATEANA